MVGGYAAAASIQAKNSEMSVDVFIEQVYGRWECPLQWKVITKRVLMRLAWTVHIYTFIVSI